ncbi:hypothetical protein A6A05_01100 [Magnetospirillum moscoviense]|uniref:Transporter n=1 Tax=Magnetospirillum moscoviense TaxID=1437059 RepID=A0A178MRL9_9PROT|nr:TolC family protein [Alphaproteobacteria bacterium]OAN51488.1 hypothetical protein A6A05_01100 [Magnetospirillum moscoviense]
MEYCPLKRSGAFGSVMIAAALASTLSACALEPEQLAEIRQDLQKHADTLPQEVLSRPLTVDDAIALAVTHNLDSRVRLLEEVLAQGKADLSIFAMLPTMAAKANLSRRGPRKATTSKDLTDGTTGNYSTSEDVISRTRDLTATWNLMDFGIAMLRSDQEEDRVKLALEKRRRALHLLVQDVQAAYWKAVINEFAEAKYNALELRLIRSVNDAEEAERSKVGDPMQMLAHQRAIVDTMRQIAEMQRQTATARADLAGLMGVQSIGAFRLAELSEGATLTVTPPAPDVEALQQVALDNRPELRSEEAQFRIDVQDIYTELLKSLPGIGPFIGGHHDSNSYLKYNAWADAGVQVAWNLVDVLSMPKRIRQAQSNVEVTRARRLALGMAVVTQVRVADIQYRHALKEYRLTEQMAGIDRRITSLAGKSKEAGSGSAMEEIKAEASSMLSAMRRFILYSDLQAAKARLDAAMGLDPSHPGEEKPPATAALTN